NSTSSTYYYTLSLHDALPILPLVAKLDADDAKTRDAATAALKALGRPAVHACLRLDQSNLSPEQRNRLSAFYAAEGWIHVPDVEDRKSTRLNSSHRTTTNAVL